MNEIENPAWLKYAVDIFFLLVFLIVFFFVKPVEKESTDEDAFEEPNELEKMLKTDNEIESSETERDTSGEDTEAEASQPQQKN